MPKKKKPLTDEELDEIKRVYHVGDDKYGKTVYVEKLVAEVERLKAKEASKPTKKPPLPKKLWVYTLVFNPFAFGNLNRPVKTELDLGLLEAHIVKLAHGYWAVAIYNHRRDVWHVVEYNTGALLGTQSTEFAVVSEVQKLAKTGDPKLMKQQLEGAKQDMYLANAVTNEQWFDLFKKVPK
jgi:hypothetical protein